MYWQEPQHCMGKAYSSIAKTQSPLIIKIYTSTISTLRTSSRKDGIIRACMIDEKAQQAPPMFTAQIVLHSSICFHGTSLTFMDCKKCLSFIIGFIISVWQVKQLKLHTKDCIERGYQNRNWSIYSSINFIQMFELQEQNFCVNIWLIIIPVPQFKIKINIFDTSVAMIANFLLYLFPKPQQCVGKQNPFSNSWDAFSDNCY